jgi:hypothetical protein
MRCLAAKRLREGSPLYRSVGEVAVRARRLREFRFEDITAGAKDSSSNTESSIGAAQPRNRGSFSGRVKRSLCSLTSSKLPKLNHLYTPTYAQNIVFYINCYHSTCSSDFQSLPQCIQGQGDRSLRIGGAITLLFHTPS